MKFRRTNHGKRLGGALRVVFVLAVSTGCSTLDDAMVAAPSPVPTTVDLPGPASTDAGSTEPTTTAETPATTESSTTASVTTESSTTEAPPVDRLANGSTPGTSAVTCPGAFLGYGVTSGFEFALCDTEKDRATFRRINLNTGELVEGSACLGDKIWSAYIRDWRYDIDLVPATPELVIVDDNRQLFLREAMSDFTWLSDEWESRHFC